LRQKLGSGQFQRITSCGDPFGEFQFVDLFKNFGFAGLEAESNSGQCVVDDESHTHTVLIDSQGLQY
jgi:hypothetical protein